MHNHALTVLNLKDPATQMRKTSRLHPRQSFDGCSRPVNLALHACAFTIAEMNSQDPRPTRPAFMSPEAMIGTGVTIAMIGLLFLLLGLAQYMREVKDASVILLPLGALLLIAGVLAWASARSRTKR